MTDKKISVYFNMLDKNGFEISGTRTYVMNITPAAASQISKRLEFYPAPKQKFGLHSVVADFVGDRMDINRTFDPQTMDDGEYIMMHCTGHWCNCPEYIGRKCIQNLSSGKCKNKYMRQTIGEVLFPEIYKPQKQR